MSGEYILKEVEVTPAMIEAGLKVLYLSGIVDGPSGEDTPLVVEIFLAMLCESGLGEGLETSKTYRS